MKNNKQEIAREYVQLFGLQVKGEEFQKWSSERYPTVKWTYSHLNNCLSVAKKKFEERDSKNVPSRRATKEELEIIKDIRKNYKKAGRDNAFFIITGRNTATFEQWEKEFLLTQKNKVVAPKRYSKTKYNLQHLNSIIAFAEKFGGIKRLHQICGSLLQISEELKNVSEIK